jgi:hypothetical protein
MIAAWWRHPELRKSVLLARLNAGRFSDVQIHARTRESDVLVLDRPLP